MTQPSLSLHDQIDLVEGRVRLKTLRLKVTVQELRSGARFLVSGHRGLTALFLLAAVIGAIGGRKFTSLRKPK
jgi:hypothetical protein